MGVATKLPASLLAATLALSSVALARTVPPRSSAQVQVPSCITEQVTFNSGVLKLKGTVMRPMSDRHFPVVIFNHGSRLQRQGGSLLSFESDPIVPSGTPCPAFVIEKKWVLFVPWRRGYGGSEGDRYSNIFARPAGEIVDAAIRRLKGADADDVNSAHAYITSQGFTDRGRIAITGASLGGIVSMFAAGKNPASYRAVVNQAGGWSPGYEPLVQELVQSGKNIQSPILLQHGTEDSVAPVVVSRRVVDELSRLGKRVTLRTYPIGHSFDIFRPAEVWLPDFLAFLEEHLK